MTTSLSNIKGKRPSVSMSVPPNVWGPSAWRLLHRMSFAQPFSHYNNQNQGHVHFFTAVAHILPCAKCRINMKDHLHHLPVPDDPKDIPKWVWRLHTRVSLSLVDDYVPPSFARVKAMYTRGAKNTAPDAPFLFALIKTHPGSRAISDEHLKALQTFMHHYLWVLHDDAPTSVPAVPTWLKSKAEFKRLVVKITNITSVKLTDCKPTNHSLLRNAAIRSFNCSL